MGLHMPGNGRVTHSHTRDMLGETGGTAVTGTTTSTACVKPGSTHRTSWIKALAKHSSTAHTARPVHNTGSTATGTETGVGFCVYERVSFWEQLPLNVKEISLKLFWFNKQTILKIDQLSIYSTGQTVYLGIKLLNN